MHALLVCLLLFRVGQADTYNCGYGTNNCNQRSIVCAENEECIVQCSYLGTCDSLQVHAQSASSLTFKSTGSQYSLGAKIYCPTNAALVDSNCSATCIAQHSCDGLTMYGHSVRSLTYTSSKQSNGVEIHCENVESCTLNGPGSNALEGVTVYASFNNLIINQCSKCFVNLLLNCDASTSCNVDPQTLNSCTTPSDCDIASTTVVPSTSFQTSNIVTTAFTTTAAYSSFITTIASMISSSISPIISTETSSQTSDTITTAFTTTSTYSSFITTIGSMISSTMSSIISTESSEIAAVNSEYPTRNPPRSSYKLPLDASIGSYSFSTDIMETDDIAIESVDNDSTVWITVIIVGISVLCVTGIAVYYRFFRESRRVMNIEDMISAENMDPGSKSTNKEQNVDVHQTTQSVYENNETPQNPIIEMEGVEVRKASVSSQRGEGEGAANKVTGHGVTDKGTCDEANIASDEFIVQSEEESLDRNVTTTRK